MSGQRKLPICPAVFIVALTTAAFSWPRSTQLLHAAASENMLAAVATAISDAASTGCGPAARGQQREPRDEVGHPAHAAAPDPQAEPGRQPIRCNAAKQVGEHAEDQRQASEKDQGVRGEAVLLLQVGWQPGDAEIKDEAVGKIHHAQREQAARLRRRFSRRGQPLG